ncbi:MAG TPA: 5'-3' exonuclease H3TH domain-containing protein [Bacillales bacterium]|nr:5'-3' exonuclease H3TH domain-containing protein [Bacillales bacterium]
MVEKQTVMLIDGMALLFRGYYATAYGGSFMKTKSGIPTNGIFGFLRYFLDAVQTFQPSHVICCWDMGKETFRTELYDGYKANRESPPDELIPQFDLVKEAVRAFDVPNVGVEGFEADDCIGTLASRLSEESKVMILTGDQDILQLVDDRVSVILMKKGQGNYAVYEPETFYAEKGIRPLQMVDLKGLMGDSSDNYPGVKGIGEKTALKLLQTYETIEGILTNLDNLTNGVRKKIEENLEMLHLSRRLAEIHREAPITYNLEESIWNYDKQRVLSRFEELEFEHLTKLIG